MAPVGRNWSMNNTNTVHKHFPIMTCNGSCLLLQEGTDTSLMQFSTHLPLECSGFCCWVFWFSCSWAWAVEILMGIFAFRDRPAEDGLPNTRLQDRFSLYSVQIRWAWDWLPTCTAAINGSNVSWAYRSYEIYLLRNIVDSVPMFEVRRLIRIALAVQPLIILTKALVAENFSSCFLFFFCWKWFIVSEIFLKSEVNALNSHLQQQLDA